MSETCRRYRLIVDRDPDDPSKFAWLVEWDTIGRNVWRPWASGVEKTQDRALRRGRKELERWSTLDGTRGRIEEVFACEVPPAKPTRDKGVRKPFDAKGLACG
jgi:hypothetical protein